jgi:hypothetical protein
MFANDSAELLTPSEWDSFQKLATHVGVAAERVGQVRRRAEVTDRAQRRAGLFCGRPGGGIELLLARWVSPDAADACVAASPLPLVISRAADHVQPALGSWPTWEHTEAGSENLLFHRADGRIDPLLRGQLSALDNLEQLVLVTRLGQPLHPYERELARSLALVAPMARVVAVAVPGEEPSEDDIASFSQFALAHMRDAGFVDGRCLAAGVWFTEASARTPGTIQDLSQFIALDRDAITQARSQMLRLQACSLLKEISDAAREIQPAVSDVLEEDVQMLRQRLLVYLEAFGRELFGAARAKKFKDDIGLQHYFLERIRGWGAYTEPEGMWLRHVEALRPGSSAQLFKEAEKAALHLQLEPFQELGASPVVDVDSTKHSYDAIVDRILQECTYAAVGFALGVSAYLLVARLPLAMAHIPAYIAFALAFILGYCTMRQKFHRPRNPQKSESKPHSQSSICVTTATLNDWQAVERDIVHWFNDLFSFHQQIPLDECRRLSKKLRCEDS